MEVLSTFHIWGSEKKLHRARSVDEALYVSRKACMEGPNVLGVEIALPSGGTYTRKDVFRLTDVLPDGSILILDPRNNPMHDEVARYRSKPGGDRNLFRSQIMRRLTQTYSYARSEPENVRFVAHALGAGVVEMAAGSGYWSWLLSQHDVEIVAYDIAPKHKAIVVPETLPDWSEAKGYAFPQDGFWYPVQVGTPEVLEYHADRSLLLCYPPQANPMALDCLRWYRGNRLVVVGGYGLVASSEFFQELDRSWEQVNELKIIDWITPTSISVYQR